MPSPESVANIFHRFNSTRITVLTRSELKATTSAVRRQVNFGKSRRVSISTIISAIETYKKGSLVFLKGGAPRDIVSDQVPHDIDVAYWGISHAEIVRALKEQLGFAVRSTSSASAVASIGLVQLGMGQDTFEASKLKVGEHESDAPANALLIHVGTRLLIDPHGCGLKDAKDRVWRIPSKDRELWARTTRVAVWRMLKFRVRGFSVPEKDQAFIYDDFLQNPSAQIPPGITSREVLATRTPDGVPSALVVACSDIRLLADHKLVKYTPDAFMLELVRRGDLLVSGKRQS